MGVGVLWVDLDDTAKMPDRLLDLVPRTEQHREIEVRIGVIRVELHRAPELRDRRIDTTEACSRLA